MVKKIVIGERAISKNGTNSLSVIIPAMVVKHNHLKAMDVCMMEWNGDDELTFKFRKVE